MRRSHAGLRRRWPLRLWGKVLVAWVFLGGAAFNVYVDTQIKPSLMQIAEYEARSITTRAMHTAVQQVLEEEPDAGVDLYRITQDYAQVDADKANHIRNEMIAAVQYQLESLPVREYEIPFGSLTGNAILSGHGPGWNVQLQPQGYIQAEWKETCESLSINVTRYQAQLDLTVTVNMVLDGRTETIAVKDSVPVASVLLRGQTPNVYAAVSD